MFGRLVARLVLLCEGALLQMYEGGPSEKGLCCLCYTDSLHALRPLFTYIYRGVILYSKSLVPEGNRQEKQSAAKENPRK
uniref:Putative secreted protein n=1 Tax=Anopheles darlingi TaxID=43151 RepID=A0A2M4D6A7_ANODA